MATTLDSRYSTSLEFCGAAFPDLLPGQAYVLRFCGEWVAKFTTLEACQSAATAHDNARMGRIPRCAGECPIQSGPQFESGAPCPICGQANW